MYFYSITAIHLHHITEITIVVARRRRTADSIDFGISSSRVPLRHTFARPSPKQMHRPPLSRSTSTALIKTCLLLSTNISLFCGIRGSFSATGHLYKRDDDDDDDDDEIEGAKFWIFIAISITLVLLGGVFAGKSTAIAFLFFALALPECRAHKTNRFTLLRSYSWSYGTR